MAKDFTVTRPSPKWVLNKDSVLVQFADNFPSFEFNSDGSYKGLLVERQSTNYIASSETFTETSSLWALNGFKSPYDTELLKETSSPDGTTNGASKFYNGASNEFVYVRKTGLTITGPIVFSCFFKNGDLVSGEYAVLNVISAGSGNKRVNFELSTQKVFDTAGSVITDGSAIVTDYGNGWYRLSLHTTIPDDEASFEVEIRVSSSVSDFSWTGLYDGVFYIWGAQLEEGDKATSYIPTSGTTLTRAADYIYLDNASQYLPSSGTVVIKADFGESYDLNILGLTTTLSGEKEVKFTYSDTEIELFVNGVSIQSKTGTYDFSGMDIIEIGSFNNISHFNGHLQYFAIQ